jgi:hypothetical protein
MAAAAAEGSATPTSWGADLGEGGKAFTLRSVSVIAEAFARARCRHIPLFRVLSAWLQVMSISSSFALQDECLLLCVVSCCLQLFVTKT